MHREETHYQTIKRATIDVYRSHVKGNLNGVAGFVALVSLAMMFFGLANDYVGLIAMGLVALMFDIAIWTAILDNAHRETNGDS